MQVQDEVLLASATIWDPGSLNAVVWLRTEASSLTGVDHSDAVSVPCAISRRQFHVKIWRRMGRCS